MGWYIGIRYNFFTIIKTLARIRLACETIITKSTLKVHNPRIIILLICINDVQGKELNF